MRFVPDLFFFMTIQTHFSDLPVLFATSLLLWFLWTIAIMTLFFLHFQLGRPHYVAKHGWYEKRQVKFEKIEVKVGSTLPDHGVGVSTSTHPAQWLLDQWLLLICYIYNWNNRDARWSLPVISLVFVTAGDLINNTIMCVTKVCYWQVQISFPHWLDW